MNLIRYFLAIIHALRTVKAHQDIPAPPATLCHPNTSTVVCIHNYAAVLPYPFSRSVSRNGTALALDSFPQASVPNDPSFPRLRNATFLVFDKSLGLKILGPNPSYSYTFTLDDHVHEAPVYVPEKHALIFSTFAYGATSLLLINLTLSPPRLSPYTPSPPIYGINGGRYRNGLVYWAVSGSKPFSNLTTTHEEPGIVALDPRADKVTKLLNNYFGTYFNSPNDLVIDSAGDIFFTDALYGYQQNLTLTPPALPTAVYRFRPSTGAVNVIENGLVEPNGIGLSPDERTMYITDSGAENSPIYMEPGKPLQPLRYNAMGQRTVYGYDVKESPRGKYLANRRPIYVTQEGVPDGFHVARNGYLLAAAGRGYVVF